MAQYTGSPPIRACREGRRVDRTAISSTHGPEDSTTREQFPRERSMHPYMRLTCRGPTPTDTHSLPPEPQTGMTDGTGARCRPVGPGWPHGPWRLRRLGGKNGKNGTPFVTCFIPPLNLQSTLVMMAYLLFLPLVSSDCTTCYILRDGRHQCSFPDHVRRRNL